MDVGTFPSDLDLPAESVKGVLLSQVAHYLSPQAIFESLQKSFVWLKPDGGAYFDGDFSIKSFSRFFSRRSG